MSIIKDSEYWKDYNQRRKDYLSQKKKESREKLKIVSTTSEMVVDQNNLVVDIENIFPVVDNKKVVDQKNTSTTEEKLIQPKIEQELLSELEPNNLTEEEKQIALKVIRTITSKNKKDKNLIINYHILYSKPNESDKDGIIAKLQEEAKINRKIITEYKELKENYYSQIVELKKYSCQV